MQLLTTNPGEDKTFHDGRWCTPLRAYVDWPWRAVALVLVTEPVTDDRLDPLRRQNQQDCGTKNNYFTVRDTVALIYITTVTVSSL